MKDEIKIGFLTAHDPLDKRSWSGTLYRMYNSLDSKFEVVALGPLKKPIWLKAYLRVLDYCSKALFLGRFNRIHNYTLSRFYAKKLKCSLRNIDLDYIFAPAASTEIAYLDTDIPIIYQSDTSFAQISDYYESYKGLSGYSKKVSENIEQIAIDKSLFQVYSSRWAANFVIKHYGANSQNVKVIPYGANIEFVPDPERIKSRKYDGQINILFLGVDWQRKGGNIALEAFKRLVSLGLNVHFTVCGCVPPETHPGMTVIPFLNKNVPEDNQAFMELMYNSHLLLVPTRAECTPIAFSEACAFGLPIVSTDTGGVSSIVKHGKNGLLFSEMESSEAYSRGLKSLIENSYQLEQMGECSRELFESTFNWDDWVETISPLFKQK